MVGVDFRQPKFSVDFPSFGFEVVDCDDLNNFVILRVNTGHPLYNEEFLFLTDLVFKKMAVTF